MRGGHGKWWLVPRLFRCCRDRTGAERRREQTGPHHTTPDWTGLDWTGLTPTTQREEARINERGRECGARAVVTGRAGGAHTFTDSRCTELPSQEAGGRTPSRGLRPSPFSLQPRRPPPLSVTSTRFSLP